MDLGNIRLRCVMAGGKELETAEVASSTTGKDLHEQISQKYPVHGDAAVVILASEKMLQFNATLSEQGLSHGSILTYIKRIVTPEKQMTQIAKVFQGEFRPPDYPDSIIWNSSTNQDSSRLGNCPPYERESMVSCILSGHLPSRLQKLTLDDLSIFVQRVKHLLLMVLHLNAMFH